MTALLSRKNLLRHWTGLLWHVPALVIGAIYDSCRFDERVHVPHGPDSPAYEYHLTPLTAFLGDSLFWLFWGGIVAFLVHAAWQRKHGASWFLAKVLFIPVWLILQFFLWFRVD